MPTVGAQQPGRRPNRDNSGHADIRDEVLRVGVGRAIAHHGELLQGVFEGDDGRLHRSLITLPMVRLQALATFWPRPGRAIRTRPSKRPKAARAARLTLEHLGLRDAGGDLTIESAIPIGHGYGSSTADVVAAIRATAAASGIHLRPSTTSRLAVAAERASDAIACGDQAVLFAHREGRVLEYFGGEFPPLVILGFKADGAGPIDTLRLPPARYDSEEIQLFRVLRGLAQHAVRQQDPRLLGRVATVSAMISQRHLPKPAFEAIRQMADDCGACGVQVAHSGTLMGILLDATRPRNSATAADLARKLGDAGFKDITTFGLNAEGMLGS